MEICSAVFVRPIATASPHPLPNISRAISRSTCPIVGQQRRIVVLCQMSLCFCVVAVLLRGLWCTHGVHGIIRGQPTTHSVAGHVHGLRRALLHRVWGTVHAVWRMHPAAGDSCASCCFPAPWVTRPPPRPAGGAAGGCRACCWGPSHGCAPCRSGLHRAARESRPLPQGCQARCVASVRCCASWQPTAARVHGHHGCAGMRVCARTHGYACLERATNQI